MIPNRNRLAVDDAIVNQAMETRMVFMFAGRVNMRASSRTGGAFFQSSVDRGGWERGWERESDEWKKGGKERRCRHLRIFPVSRHILLTREKNAKYWNITPRDGHVVNRFFRMKLRVVLSRDCPKWSARTDTPYKQCVVFLNWILGFFCD